MSTFRCRAFSCTLITLGLEIHIQALQLPGLDVERHWLCHQFICPEAMLVLSRPAFDERPSRHASLTSHRPRAANGSYRVPPLPRFCLFRRTI